MPQDACLPTLLQAFAQANVAMPDALRGLAQHVDTAALKGWDAAKSLQEGIQANRVTQVAWEWAAFPEDLRRATYAALVRSAVANGKMRVLVALIGARSSIDTAIAVPGIQEALLAVQVRETSWVERLPRETFAQLKALCRADPRPVSDATWQRVWEHGGPWSLDKDRELADALSQDAWRAWFKRQDLAALIASAIAPAQSVGGVRRFPDTFVCDEQQALLDAHPDSKKAAHAVFDWLINTPLPKLGSLTLDAVSLRSWTAWAMSRLPENDGHPGIKVWEAWLAAPFAPGEQDGIRASAIQDHWSAVIAWYSLFLTRPKQEIPAIFAEEHLAGLLDFVAARSNHMDAATQAVMQENDLRMVHAMMCPAPGAAWRAHLATVRDCTGSQKLPPGFIEQLRALYTQEQLEATVEKPSSSAHRPRL